MEWLLILTMNAYGYGSAIEVITTSSKAECIVIGTAWVNQDIEIRNKDNLSYLCVQRMKNDK